MSPRDIWQSPGDFALLDFGSYSLAKSLSCMPGCKQSLCSKMGFYFSLLLTDAVSKIIETSTLDDFSVQT